MSDQSVLILGASSDVAKELAYQYAEKGYNLLLAARDRRQMEDLCKDISIRFQVKCEPYELDVTDRGSHEEFINALPSLPKITVCLVGYLGDHDKAKTNAQEASKILDTNYNGVVSVLDPIATKYESAKEGVIAVFSSVAGDRGRQSNYYYGSAKAALSAYLSGLRNRLASSGVHVVTIKPGFIKTRMTEELDLPGLLTAMPAEVASATIKSIARKKNVVYTKWFWRYIMLIIKSIPEPIFKKLKL